MPQNQRMDTHTHQEYICISQTQKIYAQLLLLNIFVKMIVAIYVLISRVRANYFTFLLGLNIMCFLNLIHLVNWYIHSPLMSSGASLVAQMVNCLPAMRETWVRSMGQEDSPGEGNGNPLQYSCLENFMDGGASQATVHGITKSWT